MKNVKHLLAIMAPVLAMAACSTTMAYITDSRPAEREVTVDGKSDDWVGALSIIADGKAEEGFLNDKDFLYVCFITEDEALRREIARGGLTVWFDPNGGDKKVLGIRYPLGRPRRERPSTPEAEPAPPAGEPEEGDASSLEILRPGTSSPQKIKISDAAGPEVASAAGEGLFVYELKLPLTSTGAHAVFLGAVPGSKVGVGIEVPKAAGGPSAGRRPGGAGGRPGGGGIGGGSGGGGGIYGGGRGRMGGGMRGRGLEEELPNGLKVWTYVRLAAGKSAVPAQPVR